MPASGPGGQPPPGAAGSRTPVPGWLVPGRRFLARTAGRQEPAGPCSPSPGTRQPGRSPSPPAPGPAPTTGPGALPPPGRPSTGSVRWDGVPPARRPAPPRPPCGTPYRHPAGPFTRLPCLPGRPARAYLAVLLSQAARQPVQAGVPARPGSSKALTGRNRSRTVFSRFHPHGTE